MRAAALITTHGRRRTYDRETVVDAICQRLETGEPLAQICRDPGMPGIVTLWEWEKQEPEIAERIAKAREAGGDAIAADALRIADDQSDDANSRKVRVWTRLQLLAKWHPRRYGDRLDVNHGGSVNVTIGRDDERTL